MVPDAVLRRKGQLLVALPFLLFFLLGAALFRDYGLSWDEADHRRTGVVNLAYASGGARTLSDYPAWYVGPAFEMLLVAAEKASGLDFAIRSDAVFALYHFLTFAFSFAGLACFYLLCRRVLGGRGWALAACAILALSPRIFAHSFYNPRDIPFMAAFVIAALALVRFVERPGPARAVALGLACGFATGVRVMGVLLPALALAALAYDLAVLPRRRAEAPRIALATALFLLSCAAATVLFWPLLWSDPVGNFLAAFRTAAHHPWGGMVLYLGRYVLAIQVPWHYSFVWIGVTTPLAYLALMAAGFPWLLAGFLRHPLAFGRSHRHLVVVLLWAVVPLAAIVAQKSTVYDEWRHVFFVYPALVIVAVLGLRLFLERTLLRPAGRWARAAGWAGAALLAGNVLAAVLFMVRNHPYENLYFNRLAGATMQDAKEAFELDYWGLSYKPALEYVLAHDPSPRVRVCVLNEAGVTSAWYLRKADRDRLVYVRLSDAPAWFIGNYRIHKEEYDYGREAFSVSVDGAKIVTVRRMGEG